MIPVTKAGRALQGGEAVLHISVEAPRPIQRHHLLRDIQPVPALRQRFSVVDTFAEALLAQCLETSVLATRCIYIIYICIYILIYMITQGPKR